MNPDDSYALLAIFLLTLLNAFFTLAETALVTVRNVRLTQMVAEGRALAGGAERVQALVRNPTRVVATVQVGITLAAFGVAALAAEALAPRFAPTLTHWGIAHPVKVSVVLLTLLAALFTIAVGEIVPRTVALRHPERCALALAGALRFFMALLAPLAWVALTLSNALVRPFGLTATFAAPLITEEELRTLLEASAQSGAIEEDEKEIIRNVISFGDTEVRQVMTPRIDIKAGDIHMDLPALLEIIVDSGHSRIPVYEGSVDTILGIVHAKDLLPLLARGDVQTNLHAVLRTPLLVPENRRVDGLLNTFRRSNIQMAIVQDEYGGTAGLVTMEDLLEELVGEIQDEHDAHEPDAGEGQIQTLDADTFLLDGRLAIDDLNEHLGLALPREDYDTVGGYVFGLFGRQPAEGETVCAGGLQFTVLHTDGRRVQEVRLHRGPAPAPDGADAAEPKP